MIYRDRSDAGKQLAARLTDSQTWDEYRMESTKAFARKRLSYFSASDNGIGIFRKQLTMKSANFSPRRTLRIGLN